jgi:uncharacterized protein
MIGRATAVRQEGEAAMSKTIRAVFDGEVLRPEEPLDLEPNSTYLLTVEELLEGTSEVSDDEYILTKIARLAVDMGIPDLSTRHDYYLYGKRDDAPDGNSGPPMFIDTAYLFALVNAGDEKHAAAREWEGVLARRRRHLLTTEFVLLELANGLAAVRFRMRAVGIISGLRADPNIEIVSVSPELLQDGLDLYQRRPDKGWGLTDCTSFAVMQSRGIVAALTADDHFRRAGFRAASRRPR